MGIAREREQRKQIIAALNEWKSPFATREQQTKAVQRVFALVKENPKLHDAKRNYRDTPLHVAADHGNREIALWLLDHNAGVNAKGGGEWTPLHGAAREGYKEVAELSLAKGADVSAKNNKGYTPLDLAKANKRHEIISLLLKHGAKE